MSCIIIMAKPKVKKENKKNKVEIANSTSNLKVKGSGVLRKEFTGIKFSRKHIDKLVKDQQKQMKKYKTKVNYMISVFTPDGKWLSGKQFNIDQDPNIMSNIELSNFGYKEWTNVNKFKLYVWKPPEDIPMFPSKKGGANDKQ